MLHQAPRLHLAQHGRHRGVGQFRLRAQRLVDLLQERKKELEKQIQAENKPAEAKPAEVPAEKPAEANPAK